MATQYNSVNKEDIGSNSVNQAQDLMIETKIEDLPNSLLPTSKSTEFKSMILSFIVNEWSIPAEQLVCEIAFYCHCSVFSIPDD